MTPREMRRALKLARNGLVAIYPGVFATLFTAVILWSSGGLMIPIVVAVGVAGVVLTVTGVVLLVASYVTRAFAAARETEPAATASVRRAAQADQLPEPAAAV